MKRFSPQSLCATLALTILAMPLFASPTAQAHNRRWHPQPNRVVIVKQIPARHFYRGPRAANFARNAARCAPRWRGRRVQRVYHGPPRFYQTRRWGGGHHYW